MQPPTRLANTNSPTTKGDGTQNMQRVI